jgi:hypothetical protein
MAFLWRRVCGWWRELILARRTGGRRMAKGEKSDRCAAPIVFGPRIRISYRGRDQHLVWGFH